METNALYYGDNLKWLRDYGEFPNESIDLIYLDPPFNSKANYNLLFNEPSKLDKSRAQIKAFDDTWHWDSDASGIALNELAYNKPQVAELISWLSKQGKPQDSMAAYLAMMATRLIELHRVLKSTGSIYLHCDPTASHYLKLLMDIIFQPRNFRNEIIWQRTSAGKPIYKNLLKNNDNILWYTKSDNYYFQPILQPLSEEDKITFNSDDNDGRGKYNTQPIINPGYRPNLRYIYKDSKGKEWQPPKNGWRFNEDRMRELEKDNRLYFGKTTIREKYYLAERLSKGKQVSNVWTDIPLVSGVELLGYPTQKPIALLERIIKASSNEDDLILDPFCGCGTTIDTAQKLGRRWLGIDVTWLAIDLVEKRLRKVHGSKIDGTYKVYGRPYDVASAQALANKNKKEFEIWAISLVGAASREHDGGVDGIFGFVEQNKQMKTIVVQVKGGDNLNPGIVRDLIGTVKEENAAIGLLITLKEPTDGMKKLAVHSEPYKSELWNREYPSIQIRTIKELLGGKDFNLPSTQSPFKNAQLSREKGQQISQEI